VQFLAAILYHYAKQGEVGLRRANAQLEQANRELRQLDETKSAFLSNVSHELRTPLASIRAYAELLLTYDDPAVAREFVEIIHGESERLTQLVNDVLDLMKIEAGQMEYRLEPLDLTPLIEEVGRVYAPVLARENVAFRCVISPDLPMVQADPTRLRQVLGNLLSNARKFTPGGAIDLSAARVGDEVRVAVSDTGVGIAVEDQERIFERFQQAGPVLTDKPRGTGLGLAICRDIVAHHGGRIWVDSRPGEGSTFTFTLRPSPVAAQAGARVGHDEIRESSELSCAPLLTRVASSGRPSSVFDHQIWSTGRPRVRRPL
jgi:signal transduction histidine kinase